MRDLELADRDHERVMLLARAWRISPGEVVRRLLDDFVKVDGERPAAQQTEPLDGIRIYADYEGQHVEATFSPATKRVVITSGALAGYSYKSPSGAAIGVVQALNPNVHPNRNGWSFWFIEETGATLQTVRAK